MSVRFLCGFLEKTNEKSETVGAASIRWELGITGNSSRAVINLSDAERKFGVLIGAKDELPARGKEERAGRLSCEALLTVCREEGSASGTEGSCSRDGC